jgi:hypothetical protein
MEFKGTKGKWNFDKTKNAITSEKVSGILATAWMTYKSEEIEERIDGESWLQMRERTDVIRAEKDIEQKANALLISKAPEMLEMLKQCLYRLENSNHRDFPNKIKQLIKEATEL